MEYKDKPDCEGYWWCNIPCEYGWEIIRVVFTNSGLGNSASPEYRCSILGIKDVQDLPKFATKYYGPLQKPN